MFLRTTSEGENLFETFESERRHKGTRLQFCSNNYRKNVNKVMFLHLSVILFTGGRVCHIAYWDTHPSGRHPLCTGTRAPQADTPGQTTPHLRILRDQRSQHAAGTRPTGTVFLVTHLRVSLDLASLTLTSITLTLTGFPVWIESTFDRISFPFMAVSCFCYNKQDSFHKYLWRKNSSLSVKLQKVEITMAVWMGPRIARRLAVGLRLISAVHSISD